MAKFGENTMAQILHEHIQFAHGAVAVDDVESTPSLAIKVANENGFRLLKTEYLSYTVGHAAGEGPWYYGLAGPGLSAAEIEEALEAVPVGPVDLPPAVNAKRPVWILGMHLLLTQIGFIERPMRSINIGWSFPEGSALSFFVWAPNAAITQGETHIYMKHYGVWLRD